MEVKNSQSERKRTRRNTIKPAILKVFQESGEPLTIRQINERTRKLLPLDEIKGRDLNATIRSAVYTCPFIKQIHRDCYELVLSEEIDNDRKPNKKAVQLKLWNSEVSNSQLQ